jgi:hypothetical protein
MKEQNERHILEAVCAAVIKAVPEIVVNEHAQLIKFDHSVEYFKQTRPIRLAETTKAPPDERGGNRYNRILGIDLLNQCCASRADLESIFPGETRKIFFRQHRPV